jgi:hypothetical protein
MRLAAQSWLMAFWTIARNGFALIIVLVARSKWGTDSAMVRLFNRKRGAQDKVRGGIVRVQAQSPTGRLDGRGIVFKIVIGECLVRKVPGVWASHTDCLTDFSQRLHITTHFDVHRSQAPVGICITGRHLGRFFKLTGRSLEVALFISEEPPWRSQVLRSDFCGEWQSPSA